MEIISTTNAPAAIGPYSQAVKSNGFLFCSGQIGLDPATGMLVGDDIASQTIQVMENIRRLLQSAGLEMGCVVKSTIFLKSMDDFKVVNEIYGGAFESHKPARSTIEVSGLPLGAKIEIECIAVY
jgi:2-iminobutanoate/2-iminopropanoate deaminase